MRQPSTHPVDASTADAPADAAVDAPVDAFVPAFRVTHLRFIDVDTVQALPGYDPLPASVTFSKSAFPNMTLEAITAGPVASVTFEMGTNLVNTENSAPYTISGGTVDAGQDRWLPALGTFDVTCTAYPEKSGIGAKGGAVTVRFTVQP